VKIPVESFAVAPLKPLRPRQFMFTIMQVTGLTDVERTALQAAAKKKTASPDPDAAKAAAAALIEAELYRQLIPHAEHFVQAYGRPAGQPDTKTDPTLQQALFLSNSSLVLEWLEPRDGNLVDRLGTLTDSAEIASELYLTVFSRRPSEGETARIVEYLNGRTEDRATALQECVWALLASSEFRFNH
jgi:hypothetical protein